MRKKKKRILFIIKLNTYKINVNPTLDNLFQQSENTICMYSRPGKTNVNDIYIYIFTVNEGIHQNVKCKNK